MPRAPAAARRVEDQARRHYENFPVASRLLPRRLRRPVAVIYAFARTADDIADEGELGAGVRLARLDEYARELDALRRGETAADPLFAALAEIIGDFDLPLEPFDDLLAAFRQDVIKKRYNDFSELREYCRRSANPVGRLLLRLFRRDTEPNRAASDSLCTGLQLVNFLQDIEADLAKDRIYLPQDEMRRFGVTEDQIRQRRRDGAWRALIDLQLDRAREFLDAGAPLGKALPGRVGLEARLILAGGARVLARLRRRNAGAGGGTRLTRLDWVRMFITAVIRDS